MKFGLVNNIICVDKYHISAVVGTERIEHFASTDEERDNILSAIELENEKRKNFSAIGLIPMFQAEELAAVYRELNAATPEEVHEKVSIQLQLTKQITAQIGYL